MKKTRSRDILSASKIHAVFQQMFRFLSLSLIVFVSNIEPQIVRVLSVRGCLHHVDIDTWILVLNM